MVIINLLPEKAKIKDVISMYVILGIVACGLVIVGFVGLSTKAAAELAAVTAQKEEIDAKLASPELKQVVEQVKKFTASKANLKISAEVLSKLRERQTIWISILDLLPDVMPATITLTGLDTGNSKKKGITPVVMKMWGEDREVIPKIYSNLEARQEISDVEVESVAKAASILGDLSGYVFTIKFDYLGG